MTLLLACPNCAQALPASILILVGLFMLVPFAVAAVVVFAVLRAGRASARSELE
jgi:hypothetical protein